MEYEIKTLNRCKEVLADRAMQIDIAYGAAETHFNMMCSFASVVNGFGYLVLIIVYLVTHTFPWWILLAVLGLFFVEMVGTEYARTNVYKKSHLQAKQGICEYYLPMCEEYCKMEEWQQRQVFKNIIAPIVGISVIENNDQ